MKCKIENGNGEYFTETTTRPKSRQQLDATNGSSRQRKTPAHGGVLQLVPKQNVCMFSDNGRHTVSTSVSVCYIN